MRGEQVEAPNGAPVYCLTKASRKGSKTKPVRMIRSSVVVVTLAAGGRRL